jgi:hypothetical protein
MVMPTLQSQYCTSALRLQGLCRCCAGCRIVIPSYSVVCYHCG